MLEIGEVHREEILKTMEDLIEYGYYHLSTEEKYFNQYDYSRRSEHMASHNLFRKQAAEYLARIEAEESLIDLKKLTFEVDNFAKDWLSHHIWDQIVYMYHILRNTILNSLRTCM